MITHLRHRDLVDWLMMPLILLLLALTCGAQADERCRDPAWTYEMVSSRPARLSVNAWPASQQAKLKIEANGTETTIRINAVEPSGGVLVARNMQFRAGRVYLACAHVKGTDGRRVLLQLRQRNPPHEEGAAHAIAVSAVETEIATLGGFPVDTDGIVALRFFEQGNYWIDNVTVYDVTEKALSDLAANASSQVVPFDMFQRGIHINKLGKHNHWPDVPFNAVRLWDTGTTWAHLERARPVGASKQGFSRTEWTKRLNYYVDYVRSHCRECTLIYTAAVTPDWAASKVERRFHAYPGSASAPATLRDWTTFVDRLLRAHGQELAVFELWNEADVSAHFSGSIAELVQMAAAAKSSVRTSGRNLSVSSPNVRDQGMSLLDAFLLNGGGQYIDLISFHLYPSLKPEADLPCLLAIRDIVHRFQLDRLPLLNTEGRLTARGGGGQNITPETGIAGTARTYLVAWLAGLDGFYWYMWDEKREPKKVVLHASGPPNYAGLSAEGKGLDLLFKWLHGAHIESLQIVPMPGDAQLWRAALVSTGAKRSEIVWMSAGRSVIDKPSFSSWASLDGHAGRVGDGKFSIGPVPIRFFE